MISFSNREIIQKISSILDSFKIRFLHIVCNFVIQIWNFISNSFLRVVILHKIAHTANTFFGYRFKTKIDIPNQVFVILHVYYTVFNCAFFLEYFIQRLYRNFWFYRKVGTIPFEI